MIGVSGATTRTPVYFLGDRLKRSFINSIPIRAQTTPKVITPIAEGSKAAVLNMDCKAGIYISNNCKIIVKAIAAHIPGFLNIFEERIE